MINKMLKYNLQGETVSFKHFFRATGYANADYTYTKPLRRMFDILASYPNHPKYMRLHNILSLHGKGDYYIVNNICDYGNPINNGSGDVDIVVKKSADGTLSYDWEYVDKVYDIIINHGMHPIVETVYMPSAIQKSAEEYYLPSDYRLWYEVLQAFVRHWLDRYGIEEVRKWYFEVCNEPEQYETFNRYHSTFFALYDYFEAAIHDVEPSLKAGGPAVKQWEDAFIFFDAFLNHCSSGVNYVTGRYSTRVDFLSVHCKAGEPEQNGPATEHMFNPLERFSSIIDRYPEYAATPFFNDESDIVWEGNRGVAYKNWLNFRNTAYAAGFTCKMINRYCDLTEDKWNRNLEIVDSDNCHLPWEKSFFSGNRSQLTPLGKVPSSDLLRKPLFNAFHLLGKLGKERYLEKSTDPEFGIKYGALVTKLDQESGYSIMVWNFEDGLENDVNTREILLTLEQLKEQSYTLLYFKIDESHSNAYSLWKSLDHPEELSLSHIKKLREKDGLELAEKPSLFSGTTFQRSITLSMHSVSLLLILSENLVRKPEKLSDRKIHFEVEVNDLGLSQVFLRWNYSINEDLIGYKVTKEDSSGSREDLYKPEKISCSYCYDLLVKSGETYSYQVRACYADGTVSDPSLPTEVVT